MKITFRDEGLTARGWLRQFVGQSEEAQPSSGPIEKESASRRLRRSPESLLKRQHSHLLGFRFDLHGQVAMTPNLGKIMGINEVMMTLWLRT